MFIIPQLLMIEQCAEVRALLAQARFLDGKLSAGAGSNYRKQNLQADVDDPFVRQAQQLVHDALTQHPQFSILAIPKHVRPMLFNRYDVGMHYQDHMDHALLPGNPPIRGDVSVTVFLSGQDEYEGGELVINSDGAEAISVKLPLGHAVVYSAATMHRVNTVTRGSRWGAVTSVQSRIPDSERRAMMGQISQLTRWVQDVAPKSPQERLANKIYVNMMRLWCEP